MAILRQEALEGAARREKILAPPSFCQDPKQMSGGISGWPAPGLRGRGRTLGQRSAQSLENRKFEIRK
jgi:hypothetical protein